MNDLHIDPLMKTNFQKTYNGLGGTGIDDEIPCNFPKKCFEKKDYLRNLTKENKVYDDFVEDYEDKKNTGNKETHKSFIEQVTGITPDKLRKIKDARYTDDIVITIRFLYITFIMIWIFIVMVTKLYIHSDCIGALILLVPIIIFGINFFTCEFLDERSESSLFQINYLTIGLLMMFPLINWITKDNIEFAEKKMFPRTMFTGLILIVISIIDIWVPPKWLPVVLHYKSAMVTISLVLILHGFYSFYSFGFEFWKTVISK